MSTIIYLVRHADVDNPKNLLYGRLPGFPLSRLGRVQAEELTNVFAAKKIAAVFSSPQLRCRQTARPIAFSHHLSVRISRLIQEVDWTFDGISGADFEMIEPVFSNAEALASYRREPLSGIEQRMRRFVRRVAGQYPNREVVAVSHGDPIVILKAGLERRAFDWEYKKANYVAKGRFLEIVV